MKDLIYLDNNATTAVDPAVLEAMLPFLREQYGNPSSAYRLGAVAAEALNLAREQVAAAVGCEPGEILFTSCGTESTNAAILSALSLDRDRQHIVTTTVEHSATMKLCERLARRGYEITWLRVDGDGQIDLEELERSIRPDTAVISIMWANNETGVLFPIQRIAEIAKAKRTLLHTDGVQVLGKIPVNLGALPLNFLSLSGHKLHAPKGVGALYVSKRTKFDPFLIGGGQENGRRAGTQNVASIVAMGKAAELALESLSHEATEVSALRDRFESEILARVPESVVNGDAIRRLPNTTSISFAGIDSEAALMLFDKQGLCCSAGSACTTGSLHPSHVLKAMGYSDERARGSLRFSFSRFNTAAEVERAVEIVTGSMTRLRQMMAAA